ncbi:MAG TPA: glycerate kinase [Candidatus Kapabacteria bacterium]|nr:glycerate kinase [Candidatus Kapabacteria bacterium]
MNGKTLAIALPFPGIWDAGDAASILAKTIRSVDRSIGNTDLISVPWLDGARGTMDFLVTNALGSFLEVEATGATGEDIVAPIGFAGEDGKLAVIEMSRVSGVSEPGQTGTTAGIGELIQDALDEGAFSILLCHEEPLACDAGLGAAAALGVRFYDDQEKEIDVSHSNDGSILSRIARVDGSNRSFALLSSRLFIARASSVEKSTLSPKLLEELRGLADIVRRDTGIRPPLENLSISAVEFGLCGLLGAEVRDGHALVLEASRMEQAIERGEFSELILLAYSISELESPPLQKFLDLLRAKIDRRSLILWEPISKIDADRALYEPIHSLADVAIFQAPIGANAGIEERRRDFGMRLEKLMPNVLAALREETPQSPAKAKSSRGSHA